MKHIRKRLWSILLTLVMLFSLVPGISLTAYADNTETLLTTITPTGKTTHSATVDGVVTVSHNNDFYDGTYGWLWYDAVDTLTVSACEGYTITKCIFKQNAKNPVTDSSAPFELHFDSMGQWGGVECRENYQFDGVTSIEVYGYVSTVAVTGVELNKTSTTLTVGGTETLTATVSPDNATDKSVTWASDNTAVATVADGVVTAVASGTANITVTTTDGNKQATCAVTVNAGGGTGSDYILTIPSTLNVANSGWNATDGISVTGTLEANKKLIVSASSDGEYALVSGENKVAYTLAATSGGAETTAWEFTALPGSATLGIIVEDYSTKPAGTYQDTVTFTASVEDARQLHSFTLTGPYTGDTLVVEFYEGQTWSDMAAKYSKLIIIRNWIGFGSDGMISKNDRDWVLTTDTVDPNATYTIQ